MPPIQRALPGMTTRMTILHVHYRGGGVYDLHHWAGDGPGFYRQDEATSYEALDPGTLVDVLCAIGAGLDDGSMVSGGADAGC